MRGGTLFFVISSLGLVAGVGCTQRAVGSGAPGGSASNGPASAAPLPEEDEVCRCPAVDLGDPPPTDCCADGLYCSGGTTTSSGTGEVPSVRRTGRCAPLAELGEPCREDAACADRQSCLGGTCGGAPPPGAPPCSPGFRDECYAGETCRASWSGVWYCG
jgi:hypothetical protein